MRIAVLSDIHGNIQALEAVLAAFDQWHIDAVWTLGDYVGYYYEPGKVLDALQTMNALMIQGNHERMLKRVIHDPDFAQKVHQTYGSGIKIALHDLSPEQKDLLISLPQEKLLWCDGKSFLLCHGSPGDGDRYIYPDAPDATFKDFLALEVDVVLMGHTHYSFMKKIEHKIVINPGSVGQSRMIGGLAYWAIIDSLTLQVQFVKTPYERDGLIKQVKKVDPHISYLHQILTRGGEYAL